MGVLRNVRYERFCQLIVGGKMDPDEAYMTVGFKAKNARYAASRLTMKPLIAKRIEELLQATANKAMLSRSKILERIYEDWEKARSLGQMPAALKAAEMMGKELHRMFIERKEIGNAGDFDKKSPEELVDYIKNELREMGMDTKEIQAKLGIDVDDITVVAPTTQTRQ